MPRTRLEFDQANDTEFASQFELDGVKDNNANPAEFVQATMNNWELWKKINETAQRANDSNFTYFNPAASKDYIEISSTTYVVVSTFIFRGTTIWTPANARVVCSRSGANGTAYIRLYDATNALQIFEYSFTHETRTMDSVTGFSNLPVNEAIFEMQMRRSASNAGSPRIHAAGLYPA
jgi:hypothetical protein